MNLQKDSECLSNWTSGNLQKSMIQYHGERSKNKKMKFRSQF